MTIYFIILLISVSFESNRDTEKNHFSILADPQLKSYNFNLPNNGSMATSTLANNNFQQIPLVLKGIHINLNEIHKYHRDLT